MKLGLFDLLDSAIAEELGVDTKTYIKVIESESVSDEEQEYIIEGILSNNSEQKEAAINLFNIKKDIVNE